MVLSFTFTIVPVNIKKLLLFSESQSYHPLKIELWNTVFLTQMNEISGTTFVFHSLFFLLPKQTEVLSESNTRLQEKVQNCKCHKERNFLFKHFDQIWKFLPVSNLD